MAILAGRGVKQLRERAVAHVYAKRWRTESSNADVIVLAGPYGKRTTGVLLKHIFESQGDTVVTHDVDLHSAEEVQRVLLHARKQKATVVIVRISDAVLKMKPLGPVIPTLLVVPSCGTTDEAKQRFEWARPQKYVYGLELGEYPLENPDDTNIAFGETNRADAIIKDFRLYRKGSELTLTIDHQTKLNLASYLIGRVNLDNIAAAVSSVYVLHRPMDEIIDLIADVERVEGNYELVDLAAPFSVVIDAAPDDNASERVIESALTLAKRRLIVALEAVEVSEDCIDRLAGQVDRLIVVDVNDLKRDKSGVDRVVSPDAAYRKVVQAARQDDLVLLMGDTFVKRDEEGKPIALASLAHAMESR